MKKVLSLLSLLLAISIAASSQTIGTTFSSTAPSGQNLKFTITNTSPREVEVFTDDTAISGALTIPSSVSYSGNSYAVTAIADNAFEIGMYTNWNLDIEEIPEGEPAPNYENLLTSIVIPTSVVSIGKHAFHCAKNITSISIPSSIRDIGDSAFFRCESLTSVTIPYGVDSIAAGTFVGCRSLSSVSISNSVISIGFQAFMMCDALTTINIPSSVRMIGESAFYSCQNLSSITIPSTVDEIGGWAFYYCENLVSADINCGTIGESAFALCTNLQNVNLGEHLTFIGTYAFEGCMMINLLSIRDNVTVEAYAFGGVKKLYWNHPNGEYDCYGQPESDRYSAEAWYTDSTETYLIRQRDFWKESPEGEEYLDTTYVIPSTVTTIGAYAFYGSERTSIVIPEGVTTIGFGAFANSRLTSFVIPEGVTTISTMAFSSSDLTSIEIPEWVTSIGSRAFEYSQLSSITIPSTVSTIGDYVFAHSNLSSFTIPESWNGIPDGCFSHCPLRTITIPANITYIGAGALYCSSLDTIICYASNPPRIYGSPHPATEFGPPWLGAPTTCKIFVPCGSESSYRNYLITDPDFSPATVWGNYSNYAEFNPYSIKLISNDTTLGYATISQRASCSDSTAIILASALPGASFTHWSDGDTNNPRSIILTSDTSFVAFFENRDTVGTTFTDTDTSNPPLIYSIVSTSENTCKVIGFTSALPSSVSIPSNVVLHGTTYNVIAVESEAFQNCSVITDITLPSSVESVGSYAFSGCSNLTTANLNNSITSIGEYGFHKCTSLSSITIPCDISSIEAHTFDSCVALTAIIIPNGITNIKTYALAYCTSLENIHLPESLTTIGDFAMRNCTSVDSIVVPNSVTSLGNYAFRNCSTLVYAVLPNRIRSVPGGILASCVSLTEVVLPPNATTINIMAFSRCSSLRSIDLPSTLTSIASDVFRNCTSLESIIIPASVTSIGTNAFNSCTSLTLIDSRRAIAPTASTSVFTSVPSTCRVIVPCGSTESYQTRWNHFGIIEEPAFAYEINLMTEDDNKGSTALTQAPSCSDASIEVTATPFQGYNFSHWSDGSTDNPYSLVVTCDTMLTAFFASDNSPQIIYIHDTVTIHDTLIVNNYIHDTVTLLDTINNFFHDTIYVTLFLRDSVIIRCIGDTLYVHDTIYDCHNQQLVILANNDTLGACSGAGSFPYGSEVQIMAIPSNNRTRFVRWSDGNTQNPRTVVLNENLTLTAIFEVYR